MKPEREYLHPITSVLLNVALALVFPLMGLLMQDKAAGVIFATIVGFLLFGINILLTLPLYKKQQLWFPRYPFRRIRYEWHDFWLHMWTGSSVSNSGEFFEREQKILYHEEWARELKTPRYIRIRS